MNFKCSDWDTDATGDAIHSSLFNSKQSKEKQNKPKRSRHKKPVPKAQEVPVEVKSISDGKIKKCKKKNKKLVKETVKAAAIKEKKQNMTVKNKPEDNIQPTIEEETSEVNTRQIQLKKRKINDISSLRERMQNKLSAARFRYLNQSLYETEGSDALQLFSQDPRAHEAYHRGYRAQVARWPFNPLERIIKIVRTLPQSHVVADLGCGDARLARSVPQRVHSFDLAASSLPEASGLVQVCDMAHVPLPKRSVNCVVFCLSLMGTNLRDYLFEANRLLQNDGRLLIAEVESRFEGEGGANQFVNCLKRFGFRNNQLDFSHNLFYFMDFTKERDLLHKKKLPQVTLKACLYKKR